MSKRWLSICVYGNCLLLAGLAAYFFLLPLLTIVSDLRDPALSNGQMPDFTFRWHRALSRRFEPWATERVASEQANSVNTYDISGTEWPIYSAVLYLWATEALQDAWERDPSLAPVAPIDYATGAIEAAVDIVVDPNHAAWVKRHWGDDYLHQENIFYRMLLISGLTSYQKLTGETYHQSLLADQVTSLSREIDASPYGLLDDYPSRCYPIDVLPAVAAIQRSGPLLNQDYSEFVDRSLRAFSDERLDSATGLPAYIAYSRSGIASGPARGVGISYILIWAPELWPEVAEQWYAKYEDHFWQEGWFIIGIREFSSQSSWPEWLVDVDAGPVVSGYGTAASAFGIGAARANGRIDHAFPLSAEALVASWPLPDGTLLVPRMLSNLSDAPYVGEAALLFNFTRMPLSDGVVFPAQAEVPFIVFLSLLLYFAGGCLLLGAAYRKLGRWRHMSGLNKVNHPKLQPAVWVSLLSVSLVLILQGSTASGLLTLLVMTGLPSQKSKTVEPNNSRG